MNIKSLLAALVVSLSLAAPVLAGPFEDEVAAFYTSLLFPVAAFAQKATPRVEILSKDYARAIFAMTKSQWLTNVRQAVAAGAARLIGSQKTGFGMATKTPDAFLIVKPDYDENEQIPDFILVSVGYSHSISALLTDGALRDAIQTAKAQMMPEYDAHGSFERIQGRAAIFFTITPKVVP